MTKPNLRKKIGNVFFWREADSYMLAAQVILLSALSVDPKGQLDLTPPDASFLLLARIVP